MNPPTREPIFGAVLCVACLVMLGTGAMLAITAAPGGIESATCECQGDIKAHSERVGEQFVCIAQIDVSLKQGGHLSHSRRALEDTKRHNTDGDHVCAFCHQPFACYINTKTEAVTLVKGAAEGYLSSTAAILGIFLLILGCCSCACAAYHLWSWEPKIGSGRGKGEEEDEEVTATGGTWDVEDPGEGGGTSGDYYGTSDQYPSGSGLGYSAHSPAEADGDNWASSYINSLSPRRIDESEYQGDSYAEYGYNGYFDGQPGPSTESWGQSSGAMVPPTSPNLDLNLAIETETISRTLGGNHVSTGFGDPDFRPPIPSYEYMRPPEFRGW